MNKFNDLYNFIDFAKGNRKYPENTANGLVSALKIFEKELNLDEINSVNLVEDNIEEIFINVVTKNKDKNIGSLNTYKARVLKAIKDYQKYGINPSKIQGWATKPHKTIVHKSSNNLPAGRQGDTTDNDQDKIQTDQSSGVNTHVHKIELSLRDNFKTIILIPKDISQKEVKMIKGVLDSLAIQE